MPYDAVIVGGGPAGLSAALALGRARKHVLLCDSAAPRNAAAEHLHNFVTRDGIPPREFREIGREQLVGYPQVHPRVGRVESITGTRGAFDVRVSGQTVAARRIVLCTGMIDDMLPIEGFQERWGTTIVQCPYCHGWEVRGQRWGFLAGDERSALFALQLRGWTRQVVVFTGNAWVASDELLARFDAAGIRVETRAVARIVGESSRMDGLEMADGDPVACDMLFAHPPQRQVALVRELKVVLDDDGYVRVDPMTRETSVPGVFAAGDLTTRMQAAIVAASTGMQAAAMLNHELTVELAARGELPLDEERAE